MADNVTFQTTTTATPPNATTVATDDVGGAQYQRVKLDGGGDGVSVPVVAGQQVRAQSLPVALSTEDAALLGTLLTSSAYTTGIGAPETGQSLGAGGSGNLGWLSSIRKAITDRLPAALVGGRLDVNIGASSATVPVSGTFFQATQPTSTADGQSAALGATTDAEAASGNGSSISILKRLRTLLNGGLPAVLGAGGGLKVDGSGTALSVSAASLPLPTNAATDALQTAGNASLTSIDAGIPAALGQTTMAASMPVVLASNQTSIPVDTELPAAAALSDTQANPTTPVIGALLQLWDGSTNWVRAMFDHATNKALRVSLYGKASAAGDTAILLASDGSQKISPVTSLSTLISVAANNTDMLASVDVSQYRTATIQLIGTFVATVRAQWSMDAGTTWVDLAIGGTGGQLATTPMSATGLYTVALPAAGLLRIRTTGYTSGTVTGNVALSTLQSLSNNVYAVLNDGVNAISSTAFNSDAITSSTRAVSGAAAPLLYDGTNFNRQRNNNAATALASAARTATANADVITYNARAFKVILNITVAPNTASTLTMAIRVKDSISGNYITILTAAAITGSVITATVPNTTQLSVGPGLVTTANVSAAEALARTMNVLVTHSNADSWTYSVSVELGV